MRNVRNLAMLAQQEKNNMAKKVTKKETVKKTKAVKKPTFVVDISNANTVNDTVLAFAYAKQDAGLPITNDELVAIVIDAIDTFKDDIVPTCTVVVEKAKEVKKKLPWYKRFVKWLFRKK